MNADECGLTLAASVSRCPVLVAGPTHPDGTAAPAPFRHRHPVAGAGVAEALATRPAVVLPLCFHKHLLAAMTGLRRSPSQKGH